MKQDAGILFIIAGIFALWAYNTGRATAIISVIKDPSAPIPTQVIAPKDPRNVAGGSDGSSSSLIQTAWDAYTNPVSLVGDIIGLFK